MFIYILFMISMIMNVIAIFPHVKPSNAKTVKYLLQLINITQMYDSNSETFKLLVVIDVLIKM
jgi:hypothetical protein